MVAITQQVRAAQRHAHSPLTFSEAVESKQTHWYPAFSRTAPRGEKTVCVIARGYLTAGLIAETE
jgi:hypothetical protein